MDCRLRSCCKCHRRTGHLCFPDTITFCPLQSARTSECCAFTQSLHKHRMDIEVSGKWGGIPSIFHLRGHWPSLHPSVPSTELSSTLPFLVPPPSPLLVYQIACNGLSVEAKQSVLQGKIPNPLTTLLSIPLNIIAPAQQALPVLKDVTVYFPKASSTLILGAPGSGECGRGRVWGSDRVCVSDRRLCRGL